MSKFLRKFNNHAQYEDFTSSTEFILPNVSKCVQEDDIHYNPSGTPPTPVVHVTSVTLDKNTMEMNVGEISGLTATVLPADATDKGVTWSSSDPSIATVDSNGNVTAIADGNVTITVTTVDGSYTATCNVTVTDIQPTPTSDYLTFVAEGNSQFTFTKLARSGDIQYSLDDGNTWTVGTAVTVNAGDTVKWKGNMQPSNNGIGVFGSTANFASSGNAMSLLYGDNFDGQTSLTGYSYAFMGLFRYCTSLTNIDNLALPATTLAAYCYLSMFSGCTSLTSVPSDLLPATTLESACYAGMFYGCTSLTTAPDLLVPTLVDTCYSSMFNGCTNLNYIKCLATSTTESNCTLNWVNGVQTNSGTFVKAASMSGWSTGSNGIPNNWTIQDA